MLVAAAASGVYLLAALACPVGMGVMMWFMMKRPKSGAGSQTLADLKAEQAKLTAKIAAFEEQGHDPVADSAASASTDDPQPSRAV